ncbi:amino acid adenylation domain-containing protein [Streptomyces sp. NPDC001165]|uniref:amino acid adenylation domain-containing protein n=1 Tax=Streptomyces sp. NPDC001165 TaxID=3364546 RepID=UPI003684CA4F
MSAPTSLYEWFSRSVPGGGVALEAPDATLSYAELDAAAGRLARRVLERLGHVPRRVGLLANRSAAACTGYLAVLRLGATVVPLHPEGPAARNALIVRQADVDLVLTSDTARQPDIGSPLLSIHDTASTGRADTGDGPAVRAARPEDIAYILFTSGSTGTPKGVPVPHRAVSAFLGHVVAKYGTGPGARVAQTFDLTFDPSVFGLFAAWAGGGTAVIPDRADLMAPVRFVNRAAITHWISVPSVAALARRLRQLVPDAMPGLRWSLFCGEPLPTALAGAWARSAPGGSVENLYGPTELTITCLEHRLSGTDPKTANGTVPVGLPYPHLEHLVLDADGRPADEGELCLRGPQRFPGYLDPAVNSGRFLAFDPRTDTSTVLTGPDAVPGPGHWYRTGDRVVRQAGVLVHLGRLDNQVKVRGHRVELGELEVALLEEPGVLEAAAVPVEDVSGTALRLCYVGESCEPEALLARLRERLPPYMVPAELVRLAALPLNANGKVDRRALITAATHWGEDA